jgi:hypothetical protein
MTNTSATGGYLPATPSPAPLEGQALINFFQEWIVGLTGLPGKMVRPRWQPEPPNIPTEGTDWLAFGITNRTADTFAVELHPPLGPDYNQIRRHEVLDILVSIYGPNADNYAHLLREGMALAQNREPLSLNSMGLVGSGSVQTVPELVKDKWFYRVDMPFSIRRQILREFRVLSLASAHGTVDNENYLTSINT